MMASDEIEEICWFCGNRPSGGMYVDHVVWVRAPADYQGASQTTVWDERGVTVGRCETCRDRHAALGKFTKAVWVLAGLGLAAYLYFDDQWQTSATLLYAALSLAAAAIITPMLLSAFHRVLGTRPQSAAAKQDEVVKFLDRGAKLGRAPKSD